MEFKTEIGRELLSAATSAREARAGRLIWAGAVANGLTLLAFVGLVGNVDDPDAALHFLLWPLTIYMVGVVFGGFAGRFFAQHSDVELEVATNAAAMEAVQPALTSSNIHTLHGAGRFLAGRVPYDYGPPPNNVADAQRKLIRASQELGSHGQYLDKKKKALTRLMNGAVTLSMASLLVGTAWITWQVEHGEKLQPSKAKPVPEVQTKPVSPPTSPTAPAVKSPLPAPPPETPEQQPQKKGPQDAAGQPAAGRKGDRG